MIARRRREKARAQGIDPDTVTVNVEETLELLEQTVRRYDTVRERYMRVLRTQTGR